FRAESSGEWDRTSRSAAFQAALLGGGGRCHGFSVGKWIGLCCVGGVSWTEQPIHFIDFEGSAASGILEYGVATVVGGRVADAQTRLCRATGRVRAEDVAVHGIEPEAVAGRAPFSEEFELFAGLRESGPLAAHFAGVENG